MTAVSPWRTARRVLAVREVLDWMFELAADVGVSRVTSTPSSMELSLAICGVTFTANVLVKVAYCTVV